MFARRFLYIMLVSELFLCSAMQGKGITKLKEGRLLLYGVADIAYANSKADTLSGSSYTRKMNTPYVFAGGIGYRIFNRIFVGARYEYWQTQRDYTLSGLATTDYLNYSALGGELGYYTGNPRVYYLYSVGVFYPLMLSVGSNRNGEFTTVKKPLSYQARVTLGIKFSSYVALQVEGGYRKVDLGNLSNSTGSFVSGGAALDMSGPFLGVGLALHF